MLIHPKIYGITDEFDGLWGFNLLTVDGDVLRVVMNQS